ncbi:MAG: CoA pyrophosphatase [Proteobacteria bacterium]|nr:MAG: CoA pyrophosphatase [Pseudomonadota bacterium]
MQPGTFPDPLLTAPALRQRFAESPRPAVMRDDAAPERLRPAAVLVPLIDRSDGLTVLLTRRTDHLHHHPGQVSFPGGRVEAGDRSPEMTALRETHEEIGLHPERVELLGSLADYHTGTGFRVTPVVGLVQPPFELTPDTFEVAEIFEVPLGFLIDPANRRQERLLIDGRERTYYAMPWQHYHIWGATAGMLVMLSRFLGEPR